MSEHSESAVFRSSFGEERAFSFVREQGHCVDVGHSSFVSVSHFHGMNVAEYISSGMASKAALSTLTAMSLAVAAGVELMASVRGGPYHHTDIRADQFMIDDVGNVMLNDFNRAKFQQYLFADNASVRCPFCPHSANGMGRAPEEHRTLNLDQSVDVYSAAMVIWSLFSAEEPFAGIDGVDGAALYVVHQTARRPKMPSNMPFAIKHVVAAALDQDPRRRPSAKEMAAAIRAVHRELERFSRNRANVSSDALRRDRVFRDDGRHRVSVEFPEFKGDSDDE